MRYRRRRRHGYTGVFGAATKQTDKRTCVCVCVYQFVSFLARSTQQRKRLLWWWVGLVHQFRCTTSKLSLFSFLCFVICVSVCVCVYNQKRTYPIQHSSPHMEMEQ
jgi:hypothetical protein